MKKASDALPVCTSSPHLAQSQTVKRFGTIFPFIEQGATNLRVGRLMANYDFVKALVKYSSFDQFVFSNPSNTNLKAFEELVRTWDLPPGRLQKIRCVSYVSLSETLRKDEFHVFHLGGWGYFMPGLHYLRNRYARNPWPITAVTHSLNGRRVIDFAVRLAKAQMAGYDSIFCTSQDGKQALIKILQGAASIAGSAYQGRLDLLPLGIDDDLLGTIGDRQKARQQMQILPEAIVLLALGRITPYQKMDLAPFLRALAHRILPNSRRRVCVVIAGGADSADLALLQKLIKDYGLESVTRVRANFRTGIKNDLLAAADIFVSLADNTQETFGLSLLEAQACGLPTVASRFDGYKDLVREGIDGFLIDTYWCEADPFTELFDLMDPELSQLFQAQSVAIDIDQLTDRLIQLIHDDSLRQSMGESARQKVSGEFLFSQIIRRYEKCWDELYLEAQDQRLSQAQQNPYELSQSRTFSHYVSQILHPSARVIATGRSTLPQPYDEVRSLFDEDVLGKLLRHSGSETSIVDLIERTQLPQPIGWFAVMWLIKYDLLKVAR